ncbi:hypothetical protein AKJ16_DCAP22640 [Drosera capensis]
MVTVDSAIALCLASSGGHNILELIFLVLVFGFRKAASKEQTSVLHQVLPIEPDWKFPKTAEFDQGKVRLVRQRGGTGLDWVCPGWP